jgi:acylphosphatase
MRVKPIFPVSLIALLTGLLPLNTWAESEQEALAGTVSGNVQHVGFRAMILKQAIQYNLAGTAQNNANGTVQFGLQGKEKRIEEAVQTIRKGTGKSSDVKVDTSPADLNPALNTFTVIGWTSTSRHIDKPYNLVFNLRPNDRKLSEDEAKEVYHEILKNTLDSEDLKKLKEGED